MNTEKITKFAGDARTIIAFLAMIVAGLAWAADTRYQLAGNYITAEMLEVSQLKKELRGIHREIREIKLQDKITAKDQKRVDILRDEAEVLKYKIEQAGGK